MSRLMAAAASTGMAGRSAPWGPAALAFESVRVRRNAATPITATISTRTIKIMRNRLFIAIMDALSRAWCSSRPGPVRHQLHFYKQPAGCGIFCLDAATVDLQRAIGDCQSEPDAPRLSFACIGNPIERTK